MKKYLHILPACFLFYAAAHAQQKDTVYVTDFGAVPTRTRTVLHKYRLPSTNVNARSQCYRCPKAAMTSVLEGATRKEYYISNTSTEQECPSKVKTVGLMLHEIDDLTIEGNGATLMYHGKMTTIALEHCNGVRINNLHIDFERPAGSEIQYRKVTGGETEVTLHRDTRYEIVNGKIRLYGEGWRSNRNHCIEYDPDTESFTYSQGWNTLSASDAREIAPGIVRFNTPAEFMPKAGNTLTVRDIIRDQVGLFILESKNITLSRLQMHYMHGLGIVSQYTENITMDRVKCAPRPDKRQVIGSLSGYDALFGM